VPHPMSDDLRLVSSPMKLSATPPGVRRAPPLLGQHTDEVLEAFGVGASEREALRASGVI
jgi:crotonobetainyl-CoA:carnitine CoA-transferase CaiB-like acyl-CoA transferase